MKRMFTHSTLKKILFYSILFLLFVPMIQQATQYFEQSPLHGSYANTTLPEYKTNDWLEGHYQNQAEAYLNENFGFRNFFVRFYNQCYYTFFNVAKANGIIVGKEDYLYELAYIQAQCGLDTLGQNKITEKVNKLKCINNILKTKGIDLIVLLAPGKGSYYPEYIPDKFQPEQPILSNYECFRDEISGSGVLLLDFHKWFRQMKASSPYPLFPKTGIHWSRYGEVMAADSLTRFINFIRKEDQVAEFIIGETETSTIMRETDDDIEKGMNLLFDIKDLEMGYPHFQMIKEDSTPTSKVLTVADSYFWGMFAWGLSRDAFNDGRFWYYNKQIYPDSYTSPLDVKDIDIVAETEKNNVVILLATDANLNRFAFGYIDSLYASYLHYESSLMKEVQEYEQQVEHYIRTIHNTPEWLEMIQKQATEQKIPMKTAIRHHAEYMVWKDQQK